MNKIFVISAVNITEGGGLRVLKQSLDSFEKILPSGWEIIAFVHDRKLFNNPSIKFVEKNYSKRSWFLRLWTEWVVFYFESRRIKPMYWMSMHDITPVLCRGVTQIVYFHNASPFLKLKLRDIFFDFKILIFKYGYEYIYRLRLSRNKYIVVQQDWFRDLVKNWVSGVEIVVASPAVEKKFTYKNRSDIVRDESAVTFFYPTFPRVFKNIELLCKAARNLEKIAQWKSTIAITIRGDENLYARWIRWQYGDLRSINLVGRQDEASMAELYNSVDCLVFPSRLESWGLPLTEAKNYNLPILVCDLPYSKETVGNYHSVYFFRNDDVNELTSKLLDFQKGASIMKPACRNTPEAPYMVNWDELVSFVIKDL